MRMFHDVDFDSRLQGKKNDQQTNFLGLRSQVLSLFYLGSSLSVLLPLIVYAYLGTFRAIEVMTIVKRVASEAQAILCRHLP